MGNSKVIAIVGIILLVVSIFIFNTVSTEKEFNCKYPKDISIKKIQFDFINAYYDYPYDTKKISWEYANTYSECK